MVSSFVGNSITEVKLNPPPSELPMIGDRIKSKLSFSKLLTMRGSKTKNHPDVRNLATNILKIKTLKFRLTAAFNLVVNWHGDKIKLPSWLAKMGVLL